VKPASPLALLRRRAAARTFSEPVDIAAAVAGLGFVQMDPLRAPARAQDLILRQRVAGYRAGDLDRAYASLGLAEEFVHVHGVVAADTRRLLHPRARLRQWHVEREHPTLAREILDHIARAGPTHPRDLHRAFGRRAIVNGWGGQSAATTRMLEVLHYRGLVHVVRRDEGIKVYGLAAPLPARPPSARTRALGVLDLLLRLYAPLPVATLRELARMAGDDDLDNAARERIVTRFLASDALASDEVDGVRYFWPADDPVPPPAAEETVRLLAPFDPYVWDRRRFEHLHGWDYRFEAYTPARKRRYGYYALPLVWRERAIGWANVTRTKRGLGVRTGFVGAPPRGRPFAHAFDAEVARLEAFLREDAVPAATP
jgi:uncharacterized protein YcaQ